MTAQTTITIAVHNATASAASSGMIFEVKYFRVKSEWYTSPL